jgi:hypothetical protein
MSNWINSGGDTPRQFGDAYLSETKPIRYTARRRMPLRIVCALLVSASATTSMRARDVDGRYAAQNPELHQWFEGLRSGKGPCCSDADGASVADVDWETQDGHYRVRIDGEWVNVPDEAVITEPNRLGRTMVWPIRGYLGISIRCFMPGSMT